MGEELRRRRWRGGLARVRPLSFLRKVRTGAPTPLSRRSSVSGVALGSQVTPSLWSARNIVRESTGTFTSPHIRNTKLSFSRARTEKKNRKKETEPIVLRYL